MNLNINIPHIDVIRPGLVLLSIVASLSLMIHFLHHIDVNIFLLTVSSTILYNTFNELIDEKTDKILKPHRPIPSGKVSKLYVYFIILVTSTISLYYLSSVLYMDNYPISVKISSIIGYVSGLLYNIIRYYAPIDNIFLAISYFSICYINSWNFEFSIMFGLLTFAFNLIVQVEDKHGDITSGMKTITRYLNDETIMSLSFVISFFVSLWYLLNGYYLFFITSLLIVLSSLINKKEYIPILLRVIVRALLLISFISLML